MQLQMPQPAQVGLGIQSQVYQASGTIGERALELKCTGKITLGSD